VVDVDRVERVRLRQLPRCLVMADVMEKALRWSTREVGVGRPYPSLSIDLPDLLGGCPKWVRVMQSTAGGVVRPMARPPRGLPEREV
jgi:hypothetical protein